MDNPCWSAIRHPHCLRVVQERPVRGSGTSEAVDRPQVLGTQLVVTHPEAPLRCETHYSYLALMLIAVYFERCLSGLIHCVRLRERGMDLAFRDQSVRLPRLAIVGEMGADDVLEIHPQVAVVVHVPEARRRGAGDDRAATFGDEDARAEGLPSRVLEHDVRVV